MNEIFSKNSTIFAIVTSIAAVASVGFNIIQQEQINRLTMFKEVTKEKESLVYDSLNEILLSRMNEVREQNIENARNQGRIEGMFSVAVNLPPDQNLASAYGHEWYYKGLSQAEFMENEAYVKGYHRATEDLNCPADVREKAIEKAERTFRKEKEDARNIDMEARKRLDEVKQKIEQEEKAKKPTNTKEAPKTEPAKPEAQTKK